MVGSARRTTRMTLMAAVCAMAALVASCGASPSAIKPAKAKADIEHAYTTLFNFTNHSVAAKTAEIQDGRTLHTALKQALSSSLAKQAAGAEVLKVRLLSAAGCRQAALPSPCAKVTYNLLSPAHAPLFATPSLGYAVHVDGRWLVAKSTICGLLELFYSTSGRNGSPQGC